MSHQEEPRRRFLRQVLAIVPVATVSTGVTLTQSACGERNDSAASASATSAEDNDASYHPTFFSDTEWAFVRAAVDRLIPEDDLGPGAVKAGVPEYIDRQMETPYGHGKLWYMQGPFHPDQAAEMGYQLNMTPRDIYRHGIKECDEYCAKQYGGKTFTQLDTHNQEAVLRDIEHQKVHFEAVPARTFFSYLLGNTKEGFLADPMYGGNKGMVGWKMVGFPGARADFQDWIEQPGVKYPYGPVSINGRRG
ncbi:gluconate 2-dehydrogenase subunit 3 family protein [Burkholderia sp. Bp9004]|uniref:gluconate 2-dehydrogenase subunit 3 family protein n=1 Tax=Burkholderia sp. Bp9004 TaxID=2184559 RepID=UPI000F5FAD2A|nr:gluconate 2-dehydrogenase subunit 3 family protein [Burkholderia sp. Bp9004]RQZ62267.1 gluconate 2-dehydrogenase subunit 3 family protein [Burkholderia sp. Bp9004]